MVKNTRAGNYPLSLDNYFDNPFEDYEDKEFTQLPLREKVKVLHQLCEYRLEVRIGFEWENSEVQTLDPQHIYLPRWICKVLGTVPTFKSKKYNRSKSITGSKVTTSKHINFQFRCPFLSWTFLKSQLKLVASATNFKLFEDSALCFLTYDLPRFFSRNCTFS